MEERRTNQHGLGLALSVRRGKFWHFSVAIVSVYPSEIPTQLLGTLTHPLALADLASGSTCPNSSLSSRLSLTVAFPCLSITPICSLLFVGNLAHKPFVWVLHQNRQRNPLTGTHQHPHPQKRMPTVVPHEQLLFVPFCCKFVIDSKDCIDGNLLTNVNVYYS